jgi:PIN domain nuclease of toxin-antitoxin system
VNCLLDTHALLWALFTPERLGRKAAGVVRDPGNSVLVSTVSFWEISIKYALGRLALKGVVPDDLPGAALATGFEIIPLDPGEAASFHRLPRRSHRDPFDRLIVWQAIGRGMTLVSRDRDFGEYRGLGLRTIW